MPACLTMKPRTTTSPTAACAAFCMALAFLPSRSAQAQTSNQAAAESLFSEARALLKAKRYAEACAKLVVSQRLDPGVGTLLNLALCYEQGGQTASAWATYREAAAAAKTARQLARSQD